MRFGSRWPLLYAVICSLAYLEKCTLNDDIKNLTILLPLFLDFTDHCLANGSQDPLKIF